MLIPAIIANIGTCQLDEPNAPFHKPPGDEALTAENGGVGIGRVNAVKDLCRARLVADVGEFRNRDLHSVGEFVVGHRGFELARMAEFVEHRGVNRVQQTELVALKTRSRLRRVNIGQWERAGVEDRTLIARGQETTVEIVEPAGRDQAATEHDKPRQIRALRTEAVSKPSPHARPAL